MRTPYTQLYLHLTWSTWDRLPLISSEIEPCLHHAILEKCHALKCPPLAIGGVADHLHLLVRLTSTLAVSTLVGEVKGFSSYLMAKKLPQEHPFKWQGAYNAFTLRKEDTPEVERYILRQKEHHAQGSLRESWED